MPFFRPAVSDAVASFRPAALVQSVVCATFSLVTRVGVKHSAAEGVPATSRDTISPLAFISYVTLIMSILLPTGNRINNIPKDIRPTLRNETPEKRAIVKDASTVHVSEAVSGKLSGKGKLVALH